MNLASRSLSGAMRRPKGAPRGALFGLIAVFLAGRAGVAELVDAPDLGSGDASRGGSSPSARTKSPSPARRAPRGRWQALRE